MNIKKQLSVVIFFILVASILFSSSIYISLQNYRESVRKTDISTQIATEVFERRLLADDYLLYSTDRASQQWLAKQNVLNELIVSNQDSFSDPKEKELINLINEEVRTSEKIFQQIVDGRKEEVATTSAVFSDKDTRLASQLTSIAQETISTADRLYEYNNKNAQKDLQRILLLFSTAATLFFLMLFISFWVIWRSANKLSESEQRFQFVAKATNDAIYDWNMVNNSVWFNDSMQTLFGYSKDQIEQTLEWYQGWIHPEDRKRLDQEMENLLKTGQNSSNLEYRIRRADGSFAYIQDRGYTIRDQSGKPIRFIGVLEDKTKDKELEKLKDEFVSLASHELRTPMTAIKGFISMILEGDYGPVAPKIAEPLKDIGTSADRLITLVNDMLSVSRIEAGRLKINLAEISIKETVSEVIRSLQPIAKQKGIELKSGDLVESKVLGDINKVKQILSNLLGNALKFTDQGSINVEAKKDGELIKIYVTDTGLGISPEDQQKLFGKFQQISTAQTGKPSGTGLGLYISRELARKMGGDLWIEKSESRKGSTFAFSLLLVGSKLADDTKKQIETEAEAHPDQKSD